MSWVLNKFPNTNNTKNNYPRANTIFLLRMQGKSALYACFSVERQIGNCPLSATSKLSTRKC